MYSQIQGIIDGRQRLSFFIFAPHFLSAFKAFYFLVILYVDRLELMLAHTKKKVKLNYLFVCEIDPMEENATCAR